MTDDSIAEFYQDFDLKSLKISFKTILKLFPDQKCLTFMDTGHSETFEQFEIKTNNIAANFLASGLSPGDRIGIWSPNHLEWMETQFAAAKAGLILVNVNPSYTGMIFESGR